MKQGIEHSKAQYQSLVTEKIREYTLLLICPFQNSGKEVKTEHHAS